jgi:hypothetical protein
MASFSSLALGSRNDADWWRRGMKEKLQLSEGVWVKKAVPSLGELASVFTRRDDWLFLAGHFGVVQDTWGAWEEPSEKRLYNDTDNNVATPPDREVLFRASNVLLRAQSGTWSKQQLAKGSDFKQTGSGRVILFGGCSVAAYADALVAIRSLFDNPLILGWKKTTGRQIINLMLGGDGTNEATANFSSVNFWTELGSNYSDQGHVRDAWLSAADKIFTTGDPTRSAFAVINPDGSVASLPP